MSRIGNAPVAIPEGVEVKLDGQHLTVKGPKGTLERDIHKNITVTIEDNEVKAIKAFLNLNKVERKVLVYYLEKAFGKDGQ